MLAARLCPQLHHRPETEAKSADTGGQPVDARRSFGQSLKVVVVKHIEVRKPNLQAPITAKRAQTVEVLTLRREGAQLNFKDVADNAEWRLVHKLHTNP